MTRTKRAPGSAPGDWFVDQRCIDCGASRHVAPGLIREGDKTSIFHHQPQNEEERQMAWLAAEICPTRSVHNDKSRHPPGRIYPHELGPAIYLCGYNARASFGAHSYFLQRAAGNVLFDSPVFTQKLVQPFEEMGGISKIVLSHRDDVADADKWADHFGADVFIHQEDRDAAPYATHFLAGKTPADFTMLGENLCFIPLPGHSKGSAALLVDNTYLFTGDSLCWLPEKGALGGFPDYCWHSWEIQMQSLAALASYNFEQVFPGHGSWSPRFGASVMHEHLLTFVDAG